jgi:hypothetical protein
MEKKMVRRRRNLFRDFYPHQRCFIYKHILTGLHHSKAHKHIYKGFKILHMADDNIKEGKKTYHRRYDITSPLARGLVNRERRKKKK